MRYIILLTLISILVLSSPDAQAQHRRYRVELLVFWHLDQPPESEHATELTDYSAAWDLLASSPDSATGGDQKAAMPRPAGEAAHAALANMAGGQAGLAAEGALEDPNAVVWVETPSETMQLAWRRLRSSSGFRPELYFSWEQSNQQPFPLLRVHDAAVVLEEGPNAQLLVDTQDGQQPGLQTAAESATPLPALIRYYRIDGAASFRKTRYLHLDLDLEFRSPARNPALAAGAAVVPQATPVEPAFEVYTLQQSRRVQTQDIEYFDGPVFGVLALVTRLDAKPDDAELGDADAVDAAELEPGLPPAGDDTELND